MEDTKPAYKMGILINNEKKRKQFFTEYAAFINDLTKHGYYETAAIHARKKKQIQEEIDLLTMKEIAA